MFSLSINFHNFFVHFLKPLFVTATILFVATQTAGASGLPSATSPDVAHRAAVSEARQGRYDSALRRLAALVEAYPSRRGYLYDYITVLAWAGKDAEVVALLPRIELGHAPGYVLEAIGKSARNRQRPELAVKAYRTLLKRRKKSRDARLGLALSLAEMGRAAEARVQMETLLKSAPDSPELLEALGYLEQLDGNYAGAISVYERLLKRVPGHRNARRGLILNLMRLGATHEATRMAEREAGLFTPEEREQIAAHQAAAEVRWGRLPVANPADRHRGTDRAIRLLQERYRQMEDKTTIAALRNRFDLIHAYRNRRKMEEAVRLYERLREQRVEQFPPYVLASAGEAYLSLRRPERAVELLEQAVKEFPDDLDAQYALYYAYLESGRYEDSLAHIDKLAASLPQRTWQPGSREKVWNVDKLYALTVAAQARAYVGKLDVAEHRLRSLAAQAPADPDVRNALAGVELWRGWPRRALSDYRLVLALDPDNLGARTGVARVMFTRGDARGTDEALEALLVHYSDDPHVRELARDVKVRDMREIWLGVNGGFSSSRYQGGSGVTLEGYFYDRPWHPGLRPFVFLLHSEADFYGQTARRERLAAGLHYRKQDVTLRGSVSDGNGSAGLSLQGEWALTDHWHARLSLDSFSNQTPLQAELAGVEAWSLLAGGDYRFHESLSLGAYAQQMGFDDGNRRRIFSAFGRQRLIQTLRYRLEGKVTAYSQENSEENAAYFNPARQTSIELGLNSEWQTWRRYEKSLHQRLLVDVGSSAQQGFDTRLTWRVGYEHHWRFSRRLSLSYGISRARPVYDGEPEYTTHGFLNLYARF